MFPNSPTAGKFPCLALKLASEVSDLSENMRQELARGFEDWIIIFREVRYEAVAANQLPADFNCASEAQLIHDVMSGAIQRAVINRSEEPVRNAVEHAKSRISSMMIGYIFFNRYHRRPVYFSYGDDETELNPDKKGSTP